MDSRINKNRTMKLLSINYIKWQIALVFLFINQFVQASDDFPDFLDDAEDIPPAPIDQWIIPMVVLALLIMYYYNKKTQYSEI